jgi:hypothetical protein
MNCIAAFPYQLFHRSKLRLLGQFFVFVGQQVKLVNAVVIESRKVAGPNSILGRQFVDVEFQA